MLTRDFGMSFRKVKALSLHANSERSLVLRQQFALLFLEHLHAKPRVINIDETWLGMTDYRGTKWCHRHEPNSAPKKLMQPRVSMILAIDNHGETYLSLTQSNTNSKVMVVFLRALVSKLTLESRRWRENTVIFWDGARYHDSALIQRMIHELRVPLAVSGPYSYDIAPAEKWFAAFKRDDINPRALATGKK
jgi:transposase